MWINFKKLIIKIAKTTNKAMFTLKFHVPKKKLYFKTSYYIKHKKELIIADCIKIKKIKH